MAGTLQIGRHSFFYTFHDRKVHLYSKSIRNLIDVTNHPIAPWYIGKHFNGPFEMFGGITSARLGNDPGLILDCSIHILTSDEKLPIKYLEISGPAIELLLNNRVFKYDLSEDGSLELKYKSYRSPNKEVQYRDVKVLLSHATGSLPFPNSQGQVSTQSTITFTFQEPSNFLTCCRIVEDFRRFLVYLLNTNSVLLHAKVADAKAEDWSGIDFLKLSNDEDHLRPRAAKIVKYLPDWDNAFSRYVDLGLSTDYIPENSNYSLNAAGLLIQFSAFEGLTKGRYSGSKLHRLIIDNIIKAADLHCQYTDDDSISAFDLIKMQVRKMNPIDSLQSGLLHEMQLQKDWILEYVRASRFKKLPLDDNVLGSIARFCSNIRNALVHGDVIKKLGSDELHCYRIVERLVYGIILQRIGLSSDNIKPMLELAFLHYK